MNTLYSSFGLFPSTHNCALHDTIDCELRNLRSRNNEENESHKLNVPFQIKVKHMLVSIYVYISKTQYAHKLADRSIRRVIVETVMTRHCRTEKIKIAVE